MINLKENFLVFGIGAIGYILLEIIWRGYSHWTMALTGGLCFLLVYKTNINIFSKGLLTKCFIGAGLITAVELIVGSIVNLKLNWGVWDYSNLPFNFFGQICLIYSVLWFFLCIPLASFCKYIRDRIKV